MIDSVAFTVNAEGYQKTKSMKTLFSILIFDVFH